MLPRLQSAYRANHSTGTAVLKVLSDILLAIDSGDLSALVLLDLSAAFDTVDHSISILLRRLETSFGLRGKVLQWLGRTWSVDVSTCVGGHRRRLQRSSAAVYHSGPSWARYFNSLSFSVHRRPVFSDRESWSSLPSLSRRYADLRLLSSARDTGTHGDYVSVHR